MIDSERLKLGSLCEKLAKRPLLQSVLVDVAIDLQESNALAVVVDVLTYLVKHSIDHLG